MVPAAGDTVLVLQEEWLDRILSRRKVFEIRHTHLKAECRFCAQVGGDRARWNAKSKQCLLCDRARLQSALDKSMRQVIGIFCKLIALNGEKSDVLRAAFAALPSEEYRHVHRRSSWCL